MLFANTKTKVWISCSVIRNFKPLTIFYANVIFVSDMVENAEDIFFHDAAHRYFHLLDFPYNKVVWCRSNEGITSPSSFVLT